MDSGIENLNAEVDELVASSPLERVLAQIDVSFSNSMIEAWFRSLEHQWLYLNHLESPATVSTLVAFYVEQHNSVMPHATFRGQTPDEMYGDTGRQVADELAARRREALSRHVERNREVQRGLPKVSARRSRMKPTWSWSWIVAEGKCSAGSPGCFAS